MKRRRDEFIEALVQDLRPVRRAPAPRALALAWLMGSWLFVAASLAATGALRPGALTQLGEHPRFLFESLIGFAAGALAIHASGKLAIPSPRSAMRESVPALSMLAGWVGVYLWGLIDPAMPPSMTGKRTYCYVELLVSAGPPLAAGLWLVGRGVPLARGWTGAMVGAASASVPALMMQFACMYDPGHALTHHLAPIGGAALLGALLGHLALRRL